ncbi:EI24 domain-containing protein [Streptomyces sp. HSW2009]|uniref:EI24 domain-containing protein n=1 Tax=Streptomyces sp. HSW2009 TaxID=3142890 RepID=UPI0032EB8994
MRDLAVGMGYLIKGQRWMVGHPRAWGLGMLPALITLVGYVVALFALAWWTGDIVRWLTPFADDWGSPWLDLFRTTLAVLFFGGALLLALITFTAVTLLVGQPFYETISEDVDRSVDGHVPESGLPLWRELLIAVRESTAVLLRVALWGTLLFAAGFLPVVGQTAIPAIGFCVSGFFLTEELAAVALARRRVPLAERLRLLRSRKLLVLGFGVPLTLLFLVPLVAVVVMPGAVAGATLLARDLLGEPTSQDPPGESAAATGPTTGAATGAATGPGPSTGPATAG